MVNHYSKNLIYKSKTMKTFLLKISIDRPGQQTDMILQESGEFNNSNFALVISSLKSIFENFQNEDVSTIYDVMATITDTDGSTISLAGKATKEKMLETAEVFSSLNENQESTQADATNMEPTDPIKE